MSGEDITTHIKTVRGKTVLVPALTLVEQHLPKDGTAVDREVLRGSLKATFDTQIVCPVTLRRHLKTLGKW